MSMKDPFDQDTHDFVGGLPPVEELIPPVHREPAAGRDALARGPQYPESFADYPRSLADVKSDKSNAACDWKPRDLLIDMLRDLDSGKIEADAMLVIWTKMDKDGAITKRRTASPNVIVTQGMIAHSILIETRRE